MIIIILERLQDCWEISLKKKFILTWWGNNSDWVSMNVVFVIEINAVFLFVMITDYICNPTGILLTDLHFSVTAFYIHSICKLVKAINYLS